MARKLRANEALIAWTPGDTDFHGTRGQVKVGPLGDPDWSWPYLCTGGAAWSYVSGLTAPEQSTESTLTLLGEYLSILQDGVDPKIAHKEFMKIAEFAAVARRRPCGPHLAAMGF